jgi:hypothetical protein
MNRRTGNTHEQSIARRDWFFRAQSQPETGEEAVNTQRAAYEQIQALLAGLGIP